MTIAAMRSAARAWATAHRRHIITVLALLALGFAAGAAFATDKPAPAPPPPQPVVQAYEPNQSRCLDKWKCDHFIASGVGGVLIGRTIDERNKWQWAERELGCGVTCQRWAACLAPGVAKEAYDQHRWRTGSWKDMTANVLGCGLGLHLSTTF